MRNIFHMALIPLLCLSAWGGWAAAAEPNAPRVTRAAKAAVIPCQGMIDDSLFYSIKRRTETALRGGATYLIYGTYRFALLAAGLYYALKVYRQSGFLKRLRLFDWVLLAIPAGSVVHNIGGQVADLWLGEWPEIWVALRWLVDPLLWMLLVQALLLFRSVRGMGQGMLAMTKVVS